MRKYTTRELRKISGLIPDDTLLDDKANLFNPIKPRDAVEWFLNYVDKKYGHKKRAKPVKK